jgi:hypothetical protein
MLNVVVTCLDRNGLKWAVDELYRLELFFKKQVKN